MDCRGIPAPVRRAGAAEAAAHFYLSKAGPWVGGIRAFRRALEAKLLVKHVHVGEEIFGVGLGDAVFVQQVQPFERGVSGFGLGQAKFAQGLRGVEKVGVGARNDVGVAGKGEKQGCCPDLLGGCAGGGEFFESAGAQALPAGAFNFGVLFWRAGAGRNVPPENVVGVPVAGFGRQRGMGADLFDDRGAQGNVQESESRRDGFGEKFGRGSGEEKESVEVAAEELARGSQCGGGGHGGAGPARMAAGGRRSRKGGSDDAGALA